MLRCELAIIAAVARNGVIGRGNQLPWRLPADLAHFKRTTLNRPIIMGRKTFQSLGQPLARRRNIVLTRDRLFDAPDCERVSSLECACRLIGTDLAFVIGGAEIYRLAMPHCRWMYLTFVDAEPAGDAYFPDYDPQDWREVDVKRLPADERNCFDMRLVTLERRGPDARAVTGSSRRR